MFGKKLCCDGSLVSTVRDGVRSEIGRGSGENGGLFIMVRRWGSQRGLGGSTSGIGWVSGGGSVGVGAWVRGLWAYRQCDGVRQWAAAGTERDSGRSQKDPRARRQPRGAEGDDDGARALPAPLLALLPTCVFVRWAAPAKGGRRVAQAQDKHDKTQDDDDWLVRVVWGRPTNEWPWAAHTLCACVRACWFVGLSWASPFTPANSRQCLGRSQRP